MTDDGIDCVGGFTGPTKLVQLREGAADAQRRACKDCAHLTGYVNWWCTSAAAKEARGTNLPGIRDCRFWEPPPVRFPLRKKARDVVSSDLTPLAWRLALIAGLVGWFVLWAMARGVWR